MKRILSSLILALAGVASAHTADFDDCRGKSAVFDIRYEALSSTTLRLTPNFADGDGYGGEWLWIGRPGDEVRAHFFVRICGAWRNGTGQRLDAVQGFRATAYWYEYLAVRTHPEDGFEGYVVPSSTPAWASRAYDPRWLDSFIEYTPDPIEEYRLEWDTTFEGNLGTVSFRPGEILYLGHMDFRLIETNEGLYRVPFMAGSLYTYHYQSTTGSIGDLFATAPGSHEASQGVPLSWFLPPEELLLPGAGIPVPPPPPAPPPAAVAGDGYGADVNGDGRVGAADLIELGKHWGACIVQYFEGPGYGACTLPP